MKSKADPILLRRSIDWSLESRILLSFLNFFSFQKMSSKSAVLSHLSSNRDRMGSKLKFETTVLKTSQQCKSSATNRILTSHPVQILWGLESGENILPNPAQSHLRKCSTCLILSFHVPYVPFHQKPPSPRRCWPTTTAATTRIVISIQSEAPELWKTLPSPLRVGYIASRELGGVVFNDERWQ